MFTRISDWFEERTGFRTLLTQAFDTEIAGGASFAYVLGSALTVLLLSQTITGALLMATYTPSVTGAWASVYFIQKQVWGGWFVRGLHAYGAQAMIIVMGLHLVQVALYGAYKRPREVNWWIGLVLMALLVAWALTGSPLPWDEQGYWASRIEFSIIGAMPLVGSTLERLLVGGTEAGQSTLSRLYALHVGVLPTLFAAVLFWHIALFRRHGPTPYVVADPNVRERYFPQQAALDVVFAVVVMLSISIWSAATSGAPLTAPVDTGVDFSARPVWYFLFLYKLRILLPPSLELIATLVLPGAMAGFLFLLPLLDRGPDKSLGRRAGWLAPIGVVVLSGAGLTTLALRDDAQDPHFIKSAQKAEQRAQRALTLAASGIPPEGPLAMLERDPQSRGSQLYAQYCASCHVLGGEGEYESPVHTGFASRTWIAGMLHDPQDVRYFGRTSIDEMQSQDEKLNEAERRAVIEFLFAQGAEPGDPPYDVALVKQGEPVFMKKCTKCHLFNGEGQDTFDGPDLTGYASQAWLSKQIREPEAIYGEGLNEMTAFADDFTDNDLRMLTAYLRQQRFFAPEAGPLPRLSPKKVKDKDPKKDKAKADDEG